MVIIGSFVYTTGAQANSAFRPSGVSRLVEIST